MTLDEQIAEAIRTEDTEAQWELFKFWCLLQKMHQQLVEQQVVFDDRLTWDMYTRRPYTRLTHTPLVVP